MGTTILGMGRYTPESVLQFRSGTRHRIADNRETQLDMGAKAAKMALQESKLSIGDIDLIISACAVIIQPIPCNASLFHKALNADYTTAAMDIGTTCTGFLTALDMAACILKSKRYRRILIISADIPSIALNPDEAESFALFSDGAAAAVVGEGDGEILGAYQYTISDGAHLAEIRGGGTAVPPYTYTAQKVNEYRFTMDGLAVVRATLKYLPKMYRAFLGSLNVNPDDVAMVIPHQASPALDMVMKRVGIKKDKYLDVFQEYGNMVSASVPFALSHGISHGIVKKGDLILLVGTAAGLHINMLLIKL